MTLAVLAAAALGYALLQTMIAPALPRIQEQLGATTNGVTWALTIFLLTAAVATPILGRLGDMYGKERMLLLVMSTFAVGTVVCALADSIGMLIAGRAIQGFGGAVFPLAFGIIRDEFPPAKVAAGIGLISATFGIGGGAGLVLAGLIVDHMAWEWVFWFSLVLIIPSTVAIHFYVPESPFKVPARISWPGPVLLSIGLALLLFGVSKAAEWGWGDPRTLGCWAVALPTLVLWTVAERRAKEPLVDMDMMRLRGVWTTNLVAVLMGFGMFGSFILIPQLVQLPAESGLGFQASVTEAGLFLMPSALMMLIGGPTAGWIGTRVGSRLPLVLGCAIGAIGFTYLAFEHQTVVQILIGAALSGLGIAFAYSAMANLVLEAVPRHQTGVATGINTIMRSVGGAFGTQVIATVLASSAVVGTQLPTDGGFTIAFLLSGGMLGVALVASLMVPGRVTPDEQPAGRVAATA